MNVYKSTHITSICKQTGELIITVQKDNLDEASQSTDVKELSGGERSFATLALLLALGESIESPFRGSTSSIAKQ